MTPGPTARRRPAEELVRQWRPAWLAGGLLGLLAVIVVARGTAESLPWLVAYLGATVVSLVVLVTAAVRMPRGTRVIWGWLVAFQVLTVAADLLADTARERHLAVLPGPADPVLLAAFIPAFVAIGLLIRARLRGGDREGWMDAVIVAVATASIVGAFVLAPVLSGSGLTGAALAVAVAFPLLDLLLLCGLVWLLVATGRPNPSLALLVAAFALYLVGDLLRDATITVGTDDATWASLEALHLAALVALALAATAPGATSIGAPPAATRPRMTTTRIASMSIGVVAVPILVAVRVAGGDSAVTAILAVAAVVVIVLTIARIAMLVRQVERERTLTRLVLDSTADGIIGRDRDGVVTFASLGARRLLRCREEDLVGHNFHDVAHHHHPDGREFPREDCPIEQLVRDGSGGGPVGAVFFRRDGTPLTVDVIVAPIVRDGVVTGSVSSFRDVTYREAMVEQQRQFVSVVSHELRTPLTSIQGSLALLRSGLFGSVPEPQQELLTMAVANSERLGRLVNDILDLERLDSGRLTLEPQVVPAAEAARTAVGGMSGAAHAAGVALRMDREDEGCVLVDPHRLQQVLANLLGNALKFSARDTSVVVSVVRSEGEMRVLVTDQGRGIPADQLDSVFDRFAQVESDDARRHDGTGLGLAISRELVERSGGRIELVSEVGVGSTFTVVLPEAAAVGDHG